MVAVANLPRLERLAPPSDYVTPREIDWETPIDRSRWFFCETLTPLYYTAVYRELPAECRLRYNQLTGMLTSELIALLESEFLASSLAALWAGSAAAGCTICLPDPLTGKVHCFENM